MEYSEEFKQFINDKVWTYLPASKTKIGNEFHVRCPICGDSKKNPLKKRGYYYCNSSSYFCFNCNASMTGIQLLKTISGSDYDDIIQEYKKLKIKNHGDISSQINIGIDSLNQQNQLSVFSFLNSLQNTIKSEWKNPLTNSAINYLENRKVLEAPYLKDKLYSVFDKNKNEYILIPWKLNGVNAYYQINDFEHHDKIGRKYIFPSKKEKLIYGLDNIDISFPYIICFEGVYDSLFIPNAIAIGGKTLTSLQYDILSKRFPSHQIVLSYDNDDAGLTAMMKTIKKNSSKFKYFKWFSEKTKEKDINDYILKQNNVNLFTNKDYVKELIVGAATMKMFLIQKGIWRNKKWEK